MNEEMEKLRIEIKERLERSATSEGSIEKLQDRVDTLENAVSHLMVFISSHFRLSPGQIHLEDSITDF